MNAPSSNTGQPGTQTPANATVPTINIPDITLPMSIPTIPISTQKILRKGQDIEMAPGPPIV